MYLIILIFTCAALAAGVGGQDVSPESCIVWGPGLDPLITTPARYFFIQAVDTQGQWFNHSVGQFQVRISVSSTGMRMRADVLDRFDGSYIARYRLHASLKNVEISVFYDGKKVAASPYHLPGPSYHEFCRCPEPDIDKWTRDFGCESADQIKADLSPFPTINMTDLAPKIVRRFSNEGSHSLCHYKIIDNKIYLKTYGRYVDFRIFSNELLVSLTRKVRLPDMEFFVNLGDWPLVARGRGKAMPILSWCGSTDTMDIVMPTYNIMDATHNMMSRVSLDVLSAQNISVHWSDRIEKGYFRGRDSRQERLDLVVMSRKYPHLIDAALTSMFFFEQNEKKYGKIVQHVPFYDFFKFKYQISLDGTVAAYRIPFLMGGNSVILKQDSPYYEHFYSEMKPWVHYIPFERDLEDLREKIQWAKDNDDKAREIAKNARAFVNERLLPHHLLCYYVELFQEYSRRLVSAPTVDKTFELVGDDKEDTYNYYHCDCDRKERNGQIHEEL